MDKSLIAAATAIWCSAILAMASSSSSQSPNEVEKWIRNVTHKQEKVTKLHFYFHRRNTTGVVVAKANMTNPPGTGFGLVVIKDDPLTLGPELSSTHIGYAQGMSASSSLEDVVLSEQFTFFFTDEVHNGSTLAVLGRNPILHKYREMPVVGGTGVFRLARGVVTYQTYFYNSTSGDASVEADVVVFHV